MPSDRTIISLSLVFACLVGVSILLYVLGRYSTPWAAEATHGAVPTSAIATTAPARDGAAIARTCARKAGVDMSTGGALITRTQVEAMEVCAEQMLKIIAP